ncbi:Non-catalytic module family DOC2, partial [Piromyces sp. E2]
CWSELEGYPCCPPGLTEVYAQDLYGDWSYDYKNNEWCGLTLLEEPIHDKECWSEEFGYPCCKGCKVYEEDSDGSWGYELNQWCGIQSFCKK